MIVATAGHVDHGKTALVRALTGVDTDRLPEEKARGISIEPGFAYWSLGDAGTIGFVDVPGHERFVRNMLAGVCGIDFVILVVAADDGIMPQTLEHLQIVQLLGITHGVAVVSKVDCVPRDRVEEVMRETRCLLANTPLADAPVLSVSARNGEGIAGLGQVIRGAARLQRSRSAQGQHFRMAIDRAFTIVGAGTVVTGTVFDGEVRVGARVTVSPGGEEARVRTIQTAGVAVEHAIAGSRCAINLAGVDVKSVARGDWVLDPALHAPSDRLFARIDLLAGSAPIARPAFVHLHLGAGDVIARVVPRDDEPVLPGIATTVALRTERPIVALNGDRFVIRDQAARRTLGGGVVLDPTPDATRRAHATRFSVNVALASTDLRAALAGLLRIPGYATDVQWFERIFNIVPHRATELYSELDATILGHERRAAVASTHAAEIRRGVLTHLDAMQRRQPNAPGIGVAALRKQVASHLTLEAFSFLLRDLADAKQIEVSRSEVRRVGQGFSLSAQETALWQRMLPALVDAGASPPTVDQLAATFKTAPRTVLDLLHRLRKAGQVWQLTESRFYAADTIALLAESAASLAAANAGEFTAAQFRDTIDAGRNVAIQILELLDRIGVTVRVGDRRRMQPHYANVVGKVSHHA